MKNIKKFIICLFILVAPLTSVSAKAVIDSQGAGGCNRQLVCDYVQGACAREACDTCGGQAYNCNPYDCNCYNYSCHCQTCWRTCNGYYKIDSWGPPTYDSWEPYENLPMRKSISRELYRYRNWEPWGEWKDCLLTGCPVEGDDLENGISYELSMRYQKEIMGTWSDWTFDEIEPVDDIPGVLVDAKDMYRHPLNYLTSY